MNSTESPAALPARRFLSARSAGATAIVASLVLLGATTAPAREPGDPIRLATVEGDVAGMTAIFSIDGKTTIGFVEYHQHLRGNVLAISRISHFSDGSSDEDTIEARVGKTLSTIRGRSIIRNTKGTPTVDIRIDVAAGTIKGFSGLGKKRENYDEKVELPPATYWGPLLAIVLRSFAENADGEHLAFHTVIATPKPRAFDMEFIRKEKSTLQRTGGTIGVVRYTLTPQIAALVDPVIRLFVPETSFFMQPGEPPALARFSGPRNYAGQKIRME